MTFTVTRKSQISLREQIKRQILLLIENQNLSPGQSLPSARDMSRLIRVNRNTITQAYKELESEGILEIIIGSGTYVKKGLVLKPKKKLDQVLDKAIRHSMEFGFTKTEVMEYFINRLATLPASGMDKQVLVVDCNDGVVNYLSQKISEECQVKTVGRLIQEIEEDPLGSAKLAKGVDLIVCGLNHLEELHRALPDLDVEIIAVLLQVDVRVINMLAQLPKGATVGFVCENERSTETLYNSSYFSGGRELKRIMAGYDNSQELKRILRECNTVFVTGFIFDRVKEMTTNEQKLIKVDIIVDTASIDLIKEKIQ